MGELILNEKFLTVTFRYEEEEGEPVEKIALDSNERSIDLAIIKPDRVKFIKLDISEAKHIRDRYFKKRRAIQIKTSGKTKARLLAKYSGRRGE